MYLLSLYFQDPAALDFSPLQAGLAALSATVGLVLVAHLVPKLAARFGGRQTIGAGFALTTIGFVMVGFVDASWRYGAFCCRWSPSPSAWACRTARPRRRQRRRCRENQVGGASGVSNMARYVGAAVAAARRHHLRQCDRQPGDRRAVAVMALATGLAAASWMMAVFSFLGVLMAFVMARHLAPRGTLTDSAAAAAAHTRTLPTSATARSRVSR